MTPEEQRIRNKLALWDTPGFSQFISDLSDTMSDILCIPAQVEVLKKIYLDKLKELQPKTKFKQTKLPL